ncbi:MAG: hypothetical protein KC444_02095 [Nitrosopumilus sp.]|nr:hypothetical protein [Nitrosopumilus sp.]
MHIENNFLSSGLDNDVVDVVENKINTNNLPPTTMEIPFNVNLEFNELLDTMYPDFKEKSDNRQNAIVQIFRLGIRTQLNLIQQHQQHNCFFEIAGKIPRHDILFKFAGLAHVLENGENYPLYGEKFLRNIIQHTIKNSDSRTTQKYLMRILTYATKTPHASGYNVSTFCESFSTSLKTEAAQKLDL